MNDNNSNSHWFLLGISITFAFIGMVQLLHLIVSAIFADNFTLSSINLLQISLVTCGVWGLSEYQRIVNKSE